jgi:hypothetical protein
LPKTLVSLFNFDFNKKKRFPCKYLGVPLSVHHLKNADFQPLMDSVIDRLQSGKAGPMTRAGRTMHYAG